MALVFCHAVSGVEEPPTTETDRTVGSVYGKSITADEIGLSAPIDTQVQFDARDTERWTLMGRIVQAFGKPIVDRFVKQHKIEATPQDIAAFQKTAMERRQQSLVNMETQLVKIQAELAASGLSDEKRAELEKTQANLERVLPMLRDPSRAEIPEAMARMFIVATKTERELHRKYGGRVIFQQAGPEALDARRRLFEEAEKTGDLKFDDPGVRHLFYYYSNMRHTVIDEATLKEVWPLESED
jgi:hypothetical protein